MIKDTMGRRQRTAGNPGRIRGRTGSGGLLMEDALRSQQAFVLRLG